jgi:GR25 family glycosyltransferase involved in LPS biosynthesis
MITLDADCHNVRIFIDWCTLQNRSYDVLMGHRATDLETSKTQLTSFGYYVMNNWRESCHNFDTTGPIGCFVAHRSAWKRCVERNEQMWIFEEGVRSYDTRLFDQVDQDYPCMDLILGHTVPVLRRWRQRRINSHRIDLMLQTIDKIYFGTKCYRISPLFARRLIENSERFDVHVDTFLCAEAMYYQREFQVCRTRHQMVVAGSSGLINHSVDQTLLIVCCLVVSVMLATILALIVFRAYRSCRERCRTTS